METRNSKRKCINNSNNKENEIPKKRKKAPTTKFDMKAAKRKRTAWELDMEKAVAYCRENNVRGGMAIKRGICPSIKDKRAINILQLRFNLKKMR